MPGENCCIVGCGSSRRTKSLGIFKLPAESVNPEWRKKSRKQEKWIQILKLNLKETPSTHVKDIFYRNV